MSYTTDPNDPRLGRGVDAEPIKQHDVYLVLSEEERAKGFIRPVRKTYVHVGREIKGELPLPLTDEEKERYKDYNYVAYSKNTDEDSALVGTYLTQHDLDTYKNGYGGGCGVATTMGEALAETYARNPKFYGSTYCVGCQKHLLVEEFKWNDGSIVGS